MLKRLKTFLAFIGALSLMFMVVVVVLILDGDGTPNEFPGGQQGRQPERDTSGSSTLDNIKLRGRLFVAMPPQYPGISERDTSGQPAGFDVAVARLVAEGLDLDPSAVEFKPLPEPMVHGSLTSGDIDLAFGARPMTTQPADGVELVGPYLATSVDLMVPASDTTTSVATLGAKQVCMVTGTGDADALRAEAPAAQVTESADLGECAERLRSGEVTAVVADDGLLRGLASTETGQYRLLGAELAEQGLGIGIQSGDEVLRAAVIEALRTAVEDGRWQAAYDATLASSGITAEPPVLDG